MSNAGYTTGTGQKLVGVHIENEDCAMYGCAIHSPSDHHMKDWPTNFRNWQEPFGIHQDLMERICPHGVGHPDPDHLAFVRRARGDDAANAESVHGCDGCCAPQADLL